MGIFGPLSVKPITIKPKPNPTNGKYSYILPDHIYNIRPVILYDSRAPLRTPAPKIFKNF